MSWVRAPFVPAVGRVVTVTTVATPSIGMPVVADGSGGWVAAQTTSGDLNLSGDCKLWRDAANVFAQRNSTTAQTFRVYNTYTDGSNYERGVVMWSSNLLLIGTEAAGTGTLRDLRLRAPAIVLETAASVPTDVTCGRLHALDASGNGARFTGHEMALEMGSTFHLKWGNATAYNATKDVGFARSAAGILRVSNASTGGGALEFTEQSAPSAPSANNVRIYAVDNGGKTELLALFNSGAAQQLAIEP